MSKQDKNMNLDVLAYIERRIAELHEDKKGQTMEVKAVLNGGISELERLKKEINEERLLLPDEQASKLQKPYLVAVSERGSKFEHVVGNTFKVYNQKGFNNALYYALGCTENNTGHYAKKELRERVQDWPKSYPALVEFEDKTIECARIYVHVREGGE